jgi:catecholate siderophore receptor
MPPRPVAALAVLAAWLLAAAAGAQPTASPFTLRGAVFDQLHAPVAGAQVTVVAAGSTVPGLSAISDARGEFVLALSPGQHVVTIAAAGFASASYRLDATAAGDERREFVLAVDGVRELVNVSAPAAGYDTPTISSAMRMAAPLRDVPQAVTVVTKELMQDQLMTSVADVVRYIPGISAHQGENNRDQVIIRGNSSSADFFLDGVRDDVQYYRDLYNLERVEALKGPNAMIFGRGGGGGVINRVSKEPQFTPLREIGLLGGSFGHKRVVADLNEPITSRTAFRLNALYENSDSFRKAVNLERYGISPTLRFTPSADTKLALSVEHFRDNRTADRGIPSYQGRPADVDVSTYYGDPEAASVHARADVASASIERGVPGGALRSRVLAGAYERAYQNFVPGAVDAARTQVALSAYNNDTERLNLFNQTDLTYGLATGRVEHTLLAGAEFGRQATDNLRHTGYFNGTATSLLVPYGSPTVAAPIVFRPSATDADNHVRATVAAAFAQDRIELSDHVQLIAGVRLDSFHLAYHNNRTGDDLSRRDTLVSPRAGLVIKPAAAVSLYGSYTVSHLPSSGDQFSSLTSITEQVKPERFRNYEAGTKWDLRRGLAVTAAVYRLDRTNTRATDPNDPTRIVQTGSQRTAGFELGVNGRVRDGWQIAGGYALQDAVVTHATIAARAGARVAQVPRHTVSLWNTYSVSPRVGVGLGFVHRTDVFAAIDNTVLLPGYVDIDGALYLSLTPRVRLQGNIENLLDRRYYVNADGNTNISPGSPRAVRIALTARF